MEIAKIDKNLISLKEASKLSGYSADYIGQLIRSGKIPGKQVYVNVAWMTTAEAVLAYKKGEGTEKADMQKQWTWSGVKAKLGMEFQIIKLFFQTLKTAKSVIIVLILSFLLLNLSIFYLLTHKQAEKNDSQASQNDTLSY